MRVCRTTSTTVWRSSESVTAFVVVSHVYTTPPLYARLLVLTSASCIIRSSVSRENSPHSPAPVTHTLKNVTRNSFRGVFSHVPFLSFLSPIFLPIPSLSPASNLPFNPATSFRGAPLAGRTSFAATRHAVWVLNTPKTCLWPSLAKKKQKAKEIDCF